MSSDIAITIQSVSKSYQIYRHPHDRLKQFIIPRMQRLFGYPPTRFYRDFWALKDVSFTVKKGETVGIIGRNGSGKSTLLQIITGTLSPTSGSVTTHGRIAALLELGSGFNPDFTGRENVYLNGALLGLSTAQVDAAFDAIAAFADIGEHLDQPVKTYSSGMFARLAFSVAVNVRPDILIIDEALSVGDSWFQHKSMARMRDLMESGCTVLFVSHSVESVRTLCTRALWLEGGVVRTIGKAAEITNAYQNDVFVHNSLAELQRQTEKHEASLVASEDQASVRRPTNDVANLIREAANELHAHGLIQNLRACLFTHTRELTEELDFGDGFTIAVFFTSQHDIDDLNIGILLKDKFGQDLTGASYFNSNRRGLPAKEGGHYCVQFQGTMLLRGGESYSVSVMLNTVSRWDRSDVVTLHIEERALVFRVRTNADNPIWFKFGMPMTVRATRES